jgi:hypothetical protein
MTHPGIFLKSAHMRRASYLAAAVLFLALPSLASAQDVMQLDTMFRDSLLRRPESPPQLETRRPQEIAVTRRHPKRHRHKKA